MMTGDAWEGRVRLVWGAFDELSEEEVHRAGGGARLVGPR